LLAALLLLAGVLVPHAHADIQTTGVLSTGSHVVAIDSLEILDMSGVIQRYLTAGAWGGDTMVVDSFVCTPPMPQPPMILMNMWGMLDASPFSMTIPPTVQPDTWYTIPSSPTEAKLLFHWVFVVDVAEPGQTRPVRANLTATPSIVRTGTTVRAERVAGVTCAFVFFDAAGNRVRTLTTQTSAGSASATWTGEDDFGRKLPEGIYYCRVDNADNSSVRKLILSH